MWTNQKDAGLEINLDFFKKKLQNFGCDNNKLALLWVEAQLCLPYVSLKKEKQRKERGYLCRDDLPGVILI